MKTSGNTIFITGGTSGIGLGLAMRFHDAGNTVIVAGRRTDLLDSITAEHAGIHGVTMDVSDPVSLAAGLEHVTTSFPELNVVITMAGIMRPEDLRDPAHLATAEATITTNLLGTIRTISALLPSLLSRPDAVVMTVSSGLAFVPLPLTPTYNATKAAIHSYTQAMRVQLADSSVQVLELIPPAVQTDLMGMSESDQAMPLPDFLSEVMSILEREPDAEEILVDRVRGLRFAEVDGTFPQVLETLSALH